MILFCEQKECGDVRDCVNGQLYSHYIQIIEHRMTPVTNHRPALQKRLSTIAFM